MSRLRAVHRAAIDRAQPASALLEITYACNWRCVFCYNPRHFDRSRLSAEEWGPVLDDLRELGTLTVTLTGGEPLTHPAFFAIAEAVRSRGFLLRVFTNGGLVSEEIAGRLAALRPASVELSLHGATAAVHDSVTGLAGSHAALWTAVDRLTARGVPVALKTPVCSLNEHEVEGMVEQVLARGLDYRFDTTISPRDDGDPGPLRYSPSLQGVRRTMLAVAKHGLLPGSDRRPGEPNCGVGGNTLAVDPEGNVFPCIQWRRRPICNVREVRLRDAWRDSVERKAAALVARQANDALIAAGGALATMPYCPALAEQMTGDALSWPRSFAEQAEAVHDARATERP
jgi:MoaA/NifB/PqqE/SkfB family radical SAM enzyme